MLGFIIKNARRGCIWKDVFPTWQAAKEELDAQSMMMPDGFTAEGWRIESFELRGSPRPSKADREFDKFK